ncbi:aspartate/glutamate racemase family protein [Roseibium sediminicola]|uniref:Aspartate/glutamate racemase family protein n=1 Tax=Roseibium sediminicola TaxID=2933272 RepID=A0ABT0H3H7_9HYPH|nr:aspartate/glutamate racemase family protein [Roseibium sp. CAU 1639]MCK7616166.1 aspartate/glutamate racemase family protein [Roseibium sp. CAU 1639]
MSDNACVGLIHATHVAIAPIHEAFSQEWPEAEIFDLLESKLSTDAARRGGADTSFLPRFETLTRYAFDAGASGVLFTCSAFGAAIENAAKAFQPAPVLKPNEAMFEQALQIGLNVGMVGTFAPAVQSMKAEFDELKQRRNPHATLEVLVADGAIEALRNGDGALHDDLCKKAALRLKNIDVLLLAHFSTARAEECVSSVVSCPVLTSPKSAVQSLKNKLQ